VWLYSKGSPQTKVKTDAELDVDLECKGAGPAYGEDQRLLGRRLGSQQVAVASAAVLLCFLLIQAYTVRYAILQSRLYTDEAKKEAIKYTADANSKLKDANSILKADLEGRVSAVDGHVDYLTSLALRPRHPPNHEVPQCSWANGATYTQPYWSVSEGDAYQAVVEQLNAAKIKYFLAHGSLLGAYRHAGPIPDDGDMDIVFPVWLNGMAKCGDIYEWQVGEADTYAVVPILKGYAKNDESQLTLCDKTRDAYVDDTEKFFSDRMGDFLKKNSKTDYGGRRLVFANGAEVDWIVSIADVAYVNQGPLCRCPFGRTYAYCLEDSLTELKRNYGEGVLVPDESKQEAIRNAIDANQITWHPSHYQAT